MEEGFAIEQQYINEGTSSSSQDGAGDGARVSSEFIICYVESKKKDNKWWLVAPLFFLTDEEIWTAPKRKL